MAISNSTALKAAEKKQNSKKKAVTKAKTARASSKPRAPKKSVATDYAKKKDKRELLAAAANIVKSGPKKQMKPVNVTKTRRRY